MVRRAIAIPLSFLVLFSLVESDVKTTEKNSLKLAKLCPKSYLRLGHSCYYFSGDMMTWQDAYFDCRRRRGMLTSINTLWEDLTLRTYLNKPQLTRLNRWIGGEFNWKTQQWIWGASGKSMNYLGFPPTNKPLGGEWQCVYLSPSLFYRWNFASCFTVMHYICETPQRRRRHRAKPTEGPSRLQ